MYIYILDIDITMKVLQCNIMTELYHAVQHKVKMCINNYIIQFAPADFALLEQGNHRSIAVDKIAINKQQ